MTYWAQARGEDKDKAEGKLDPRAKQALAEVMLKVRDRTHYRITELRGNVCLLIDQFVKAGCYQEPLIEVQEGDHNFSIRFTDHLTALFKQVEEQIANQEVDRALTKISERILALDAEVTELKPKTKTAGD